MFIIGNGFDCYGHNMNTQYVDFKLYLEKSFPNLKEQSDEVNMIVQTLNECSKPNWCNLEDCLGTDFIENIYYGNEWSYCTTNLEEDCNIFHSVYNNENLTLSLINTYKKLDELFKSWVFNTLGKIDFNTVEKLKETPTLKNGLFLSFNYSLTLEKLYDVSSKNICYIHGKSSNKNSCIYFGHGNDDEIEEDVQYIGISTAYNELKKSLRKKTNQAILDNRAFFEKLSNIEKIYSYGFSFSSVDMVYLEEICKYVNSNKISWYFNRYDWINNKENVKKVKDLGFNVHCTSEWKDKLGKIL